MPRSGGLNLTAPANTAHVAPAAASLRGGFAIDIRTMLSLRTLGELRLVDEAGREPLAGRRKELVLLAYLARRRPRRVPRPELAALLWGERPELNARNSLRQAIHRLRGAISEGLHADGDGISLDDPAVDLDLAMFESALTSGRYADAVALWHGDFLSGADDVGDESCREWIEEERQRLRKRLTWAFEQLVGDALARGTYREAARWGEEWTAASPLDETAHRQLIRALRLDGRIGDARACHATFVARHREQLGCDASSQFLRLAADLETSSADASVTPRGRPTTAVGVFPPSRSFIGRRSAFVQLTEAWASTCSGVGSIVLVEGTEGSGKTRLVQEFLRWLTTENADVLVLQAVATAAHTAEPWSTLRELVGPIINAPGLIGASPAVLGELSWLIPTLRDRFPRLAAASGEAFRLRDAFGETLSALASEQPLLIVLDNFDRADPATMRSVLALASRVSSLRVMLLLTCCPKDVGEHSPLGPLLLNVADIRRVWLLPFATDDVEQLLRTVVALASAERRVLAQRLHDETEGNPRFVLDTIDALVQDGWLIRDPSGDSRIAPNLDQRPLPLPASMRAEIARRLARVTPEARELAETMAVSATPVDLATLAKVRRLSTASVYAAVDELVAERLVAPAPTGFPLGHYSFTHEAGRRAIALSLSGEQRLALQRAMGDDVPPTAPPASAAPSNLSRSWRGRWRVAVLVAAVLMLGGIAAGIVSARRTHDEKTLVAVGLIRDFAAPDSGLASALADMLATNLARVPGLGVLSNARMLEVVRELELAPGNGGDSSHLQQMMWRAAQLAGAGELVEGELYRDGPRQLRLDLRRVDARSGVVRDVATVRGSTPFQLVDLATARLASAAHLVADTLRIADVTTNSIAAYRFYDEGLRAYHQDGDMPTAKRLFLAATREDSTFAMARYYLAMISGGGPGEGWQEFEQADRLADRASDRERLLIRTTWAFERNDPASVAFAETLAVRYPNEPDGLLLMAGTRVWAGRFLESIPIARRVIAMDSVYVRRAGTPTERGGGQFSRTPLRCLACDAYSSISNAYWLADSMEAMMRTVQQRVRLRPNSAAEWLGLAWTYMYAGRYSEALEAFRHSQTLGADVSPFAQFFFINLAIRSGDFGMADRLLDDILKSEPVSPQTTQWWYAISLRHQGRLAAALTQARLERAAEERLDPTHVLGFDGATMEALVLLEMGRAREAAARFDSIATRSAPTGDVLRSRAARHRAWMLTHEATSLAAAGDTGALGRLADSIQILGQQSSYGRDQRLHHYVRGLLYIARHQPEQAVTELNAAVYSWTLGYTRVNLELARTLLALKRPQEAIAALRPALHGSLDGSSLYVSRTEIQESMARAFDDAGQRDSARVYYERVANAWSHADPRFHERRQFASMRAKALTSNGIEPSPRRGRNAN